MPLDLLLVEDSPGDVRLLREAFKHANPTARLHVTEDGNEAIAFLSQQGAYANSPRPGLILLDLNLPNVDGHQVLAHIKQDASLKSIPTVILTTSVDEADIHQSYKLSANCYLNKPVDFEEFMGLAKSINDFWLRRVKLPLMMSGGATK
jgi:two-component system, chemotaxis family, response regulator Rcp1